MSTGPRDPAGSLTDETRAGAAVPPAPDASGPPPSMSRAVMTGASWATTARLVTQLLQFLVGLVLARLLAPEEFGLVASVYVITGFSLIFFELGLGAALVQKKQLTERDKATVFWINGLGGVVFAGLLALAAPLVADFYGEPRLTGLTPLVALAFTLSIGVVHNAMLQRDLRFRAVATIEVVAAVLGHGTTLVTALLGAGAYALVYGPLVTSAAVSAGSLLAVRWRPHHFVSWTSVRELWTFSSGLLGFNVVNYWGRNADNLLVGRELGSAPLGLYNRAYNLMLLPINQVTAALGRVMFAALASMQGDTDRMRSAYLRALRVVNALTIPLLVGLAAAADGLVRLLWGPTWDATVPILQVLCLAGLPQCIGTSTGWLYQAQGRTRTMFRMGVVGTVVGVVAIVVGLQWGVVGVAVGVMVRYWLMMPIGVHVAGRGVGLRARTVLLGALPTFASAALMGAAVWAFPLVVGADRREVWVVLVQVALGVVVYAGLMGLLARSLLRDTLAVVRRRGA